MAHPRPGAARRAFAPERLDRRGFDAALQALLEAHAAERREPRLGPLRAVPRLRLLHVLHGLRGLPPLHPLQRLPHLLAPHPLPRLRRLPRLRLLRALGELRRRPPTWCSAATAPTAPTASAASASPRRTSTSSTALHPQRVLPDHGEAARRARARHEATLTGRSCSRCCSRRPSATVAPARARPGDAVLVTVLDAATAARGHAGRPAAPASGPPERGAGWRWRRSPPRPCPGRPWSR